MNGHKCAKDIFQCDIFPSSSLKKTQENSDSYTKEEGKTLKSLYSVNTMQGSNAVDENKQNTSYKYQEKIINNTEKKKEKSKASLHDNVEKKNAKENTTSELDFLIDFYFPQCQKGDKFYKEQKNEQFCNDSKTVQYFDKHKNEQPPCGDKNDIKECHSFGDYIELDESNNNCNKGDNNKVNNKGVNEEPIYDEIYEQGNISTKESVRIVKKRKPPNKPPRIFSHSSIDSNTSINSNGSNQSCDSPIR